MYNDNLDSHRLDTFNLPYNVARAPLDKNLHLRSGSKNTYVTFKGELATRNGLSDYINYTDTVIPKRIWYYETLTPIAGQSGVGQFLLATVYDGGTGYYKLMYCRAGLTAPTSTNWVDVNTLSVINQSTQPHSVVVVRGKAYIKAYPHSSATDKLGLFTWEISTGGVQQTGYWGLLGPTIPAKVGGSGAAARMSYGDVSSSATTVVVTQQVIGSAVPATPFTVIADRELMTVTAIATNSPAAGYDTFTVTRGVNGTVADAHSDGTILFYRNFGASAHNVSAANGWAYSYCWKNKNGHYSNRAPLQTNMDALPSRTGPIRRLIPTITVTCPSSATEYPSILILRSTDGGGIFWPLTEIDNPATATTTFEDKYFPTGSTAASQGSVYRGPIYDRTLPGTAYQDPVEDEWLTGQARGPGLDTNSPLPGVNYPKVVGTDTPETDTTQLVYWNGRIWLGVGNVLYYTCQEEMTYGIPEEGCNTVPDGTGNYFKFQEGLTQLIPCKDYMLVFTRRGRVLKVSGNLKETFVINKYLEGVGFAKGHPLAQVQAEDKLFILSHDYHIYMMDDATQRIISHPLGDSLKSLVVAGYEIQFAYYTVNESDFKANWLVVAACASSGMTGGKVFVYDLYKSQRLTRNYSDNLERSAQDIYEKVYDFWNSPWDINAYSVVSAPYNDGAGNTIQKLWFTTGTTTANRYGLRYYSSNLSQLSNYGTEVGPDWDWIANFNVFTVPVGYHVNTLREPALHANLWQIGIERLLFDADKDPSMGVYLDGVSSNFVAANPQEDQFTQGDGYRLLWGGFNVLCRYAAPRLEMMFPNKPINVQKMIISFSAVAGGV